MLNQIKSHPPIKEDFSVREAIDKKTGNIRRFYSYKRKPAKSILLDTPLAKQLAGYVLIEKDLRSALIWLTEIDRIRGDDVEKYSNKGAHRSPDRDKYNIIKGLFVAALTFYGKAFSQCEGRKIKLDRRQIEKEFHTTHDTAIDFRNNFAAHSGAKLFEKARVVLVLPPKNKAIFPMIFREINQPDLFMQSEGEKTFRQLIEHAQSTCHRKIDELHNKIYKEEVIPRGYNYWANK